VAAPKAKQSFEDLYRQLEETVSKLEQGGLSLDDSLEAYEAAVALANECQRLLDEADLRITKLRESIQLADAQEAYEAGEPPDEDEV
jgi:exodeoxyribonuclease VII small subunit